MVKAAYKQTEVGDIPDDWNVLPADDVCLKVVDCKNRTPPVIEGGEFAVVRTTNVRNGRFVEDGLRFTDEESFNIWTKRAIPQDGDVMITREAPLGEVCLVPDNHRVCLGQRMMMYRPDTDKIESKFLLYALLSDRVQKNLRDKLGGSTVGHARVDDVRMLKVPVPPDIREQKAIAEAMSDIDELIDLLEKTIAKKRDIKTATMQQLLTGKKRLPGFGEGKGTKQTELGEIPEDWEALRLGEVLRIRHGKSQKEVEAADGEYPILATGGVIGRAREPLYSKPSVLIGRKGTIDVPYFMDTPFWTVDTLFYSEIVEDADPKFIFYKFGFIDWYKYNEASGVPSLNSASIENIVQSFPNTREEQEAIGEFISDFDIEIDALEQRLTKTKAIKQGMMQELLTGRTRLV